MRKRFAPFETPWTKEIQKCGKTNRRYLTVTCEGHALDAAQFAIRFERDVFQQGAASENGRT
jgi:hypothetical protein